MATISLSTQDLINKFNNATFDGNIKLINSLLDKNGVYNIQDNDLETIEVKKEGFINWYEEKLSHTSIKESVLDQCISCSFGNHILIFNDGLFPFKPKDSSERSKSGLMLASKDGKINKIVFCFAFLKTENKYIFECVGQILKEYMKDGTSIEQALEKFNNNPDYDHLKFESKNQEFED